MANLVEKMAGQLATATLEETKENGIAAKVSQATTLSGIKEKIKQQIEYYLSRENLASDAYLVSLMSAELFVPISVIASFGKIKALNADEELILDSLRSSDKITIDETAKKIRPNFQLKRNTIIIRNLPSACKVEKIKSFFEDNNFPPIQSIKPDIGDNWFLSFNTEDDAVSALELVRGRTFEGIPLAARFKSESLLKNTGFAGARISPPLEGLQYRTWSQKKYPSYNVDGGADVYGESYTTVEGDEGFGSRRKTFSGRNMNTHFYKKIGKINGYRVPPNNNTNRRYSQPKLTVDNFPPLSKASSGNSSPAPSPTRAFSAVVAGRVKNTIETEAPLTEMS